MKKSPVAYSDKRIKRITLMPGFLLKIKGKLDSGKGETIPNAYIHKNLNIKVTDNEVSLIHDNNMIAKTMLEKERKAAASAITNIAQKKRKLCGIPGEVSEDSDSPFVVRENNRNKKAKQEILADINHCYEELSIIQEQLIGGQTVLDERVEKTRNLGMRSVNKYIEGVQSAIMWRSTEIKMLRRRTYEFFGFLQKKRKQYFGTRSARGCAAQKNH